MLPCHVTQASGTALLPELNVVVFRYMSAGTSSFLRFSTIGISAVNAIMGSRGLLGHVVRGKKKASYNHFDSYPQGLGVELARFIKSLSAEQLEEMKAMVEQVHWYREITHLNTVA